jgi:Tfp pilus assembly protein PilZ
MFFDMNDDRRLFERFSARFPVKYKDSRNDFGIAVFLRDVSAGGAKILSREKLFLNDNISLLVKLPDSKDPFPINGQVVWTSNGVPQIWDIGIRFHKINPLGLWRIFKHCLD